MKATAAALLAFTLVGCANEGTLVSLRSDIAKQADAQRRATQILSDRVASIEGNANACVARDQKTGTALEKLNTILDKLKDSLMGSVRPECPPCSP